MPDSPVGFETVDLLPTEITAVKEIMVFMQRKLPDCLSKSDEQAKVRALAYWANEAENRLKEIGLVCIVDPYDTAEDAKGNGVLSPEWSITGRTTNTELDHDQFQHEVIHGLSDGRVGKVNLDGKWSDPDLHL